MSPLLRPFLAISCFLTLLPGQALPAPAAAKSEAAAGRTYQLRLADLLARDEPLFLRGRDSELTIAVPVSGRLEIRSALLHLELTNSVSLVAERSQLRVSLNDLVVAQIPLKPHQPSASADVRLPLQLLKPGYNRLTFNAAQHYSTTQCEDPASAELWTQIDAVNSTLTFQAAPRALDPTLAEFEELVDRRLWTPYGLRILTPAEHVDREHLPWGSLVAQAAALRLDYVPLLVRHAVARPTSTPAAARAGRRFPRLNQGELAGMDNALVGTREELAGLLGEEMSARIEGAFLGIFPLDEDPSLFLLIVSGRNTEEVTRAATALTHLSFPFPDTPSMTVIGIDPPAPVLYAAKSVLHEGESEPLSRFGFATTTFKGLGAERATIEVRVPGDLFSASDGQVELSLHLAHGAGLRGDSVLNIFLNGRFENVIHLRDASGAVYRDYKLRIPLSSFGPGRNSLTFEPRMMPLVTGECVAINDENLLLTLFDDSKISAPDAAHYARLPDLALFARTGFPHAVRPDGSDLALQVAGADSSTVAAAWTLIAKMAQVVGAPLYRAEIGFAVPKGDKDVILVGAQDQIDKGFWKAASLGLGEPMSVPYPSLLVPREGARQGWFQRWLARWLPSLQAESLQATPAVTRILEQGGLGRYSAALQFESPLRAGRTALIVTAGDADHLLEGMTSLVEPGLWGSLRGDCALWTRGAESLRWQAAAKAYHVGRVDVSTRIEYYFSKYPAYWVATLVVLFAVLAWLTRRLLVRFRLRQHPHVRDTS